MKPITITEATIIAAIIAAFVAVIGSFASLYATYRLKVKEFRVDQIKSRIDTLEQASVIRGPESNSSEGKSEEYQHPMKEIWKDVLHRLRVTEQQFAKYKWLLDRENHATIDSLLKECNKRSSKFTADYIDPAHDRQKLNQDFVVFAEKTDELQKAYEEARLLVIERLYLSLKEEVGI